MSPLRLCFPYLSTPPEKVGDNTFASAIAPGHYVAGVSGGEMEDDLVIKNIRMEQIDLYGMR